MRTAVIGIGSNSVRMLLADVEGHQGKKLRREREGTRLFAGLDAARRLSDESMAHTAQVVAWMAESARRDGAENVTVFATSATRDAANQAAFAGLISAQAQTPLEILSGEEEALLSFLGASGSGLSGVIDIGGGSTEIVVGEGHTLNTSFSCQMGAVRLCRLLPLTCAAELNSVIAHADQILAENLSAHPIQTLPPRWYGTGGTFTTLAAMVRGVPWTDRTHMHGTVLRLEDVCVHAALLADMPLEERKRHQGLQPNRADIIVHGIAILIACMRRLGMNEITVSEHGNLEGWLIRRYGLEAIG